MPCIAVYILEQAAAGDMPALPRVSVYITKQAAVGKTAALAAHSRLYHETSGGGQDDYAFAYVFAAHNLITSC